MMLCGKFGLYCFVCVVFSNQPDHLSHPLSRWERLGQLGRLERLSPGELRPEESQKKRELYCEGPVSFLKIT